MLRITSDKFYVVREDAHGTGSIYVPISVLSRCLLQIEFYGNDDSCAHVFLWHPRDPIELLQPHYPNAGWRESLVRAGYIQETDFSVLDNTAHGGGYPSTVLTEEELANLACKVRKLNIGQDLFTYKRIIVQSSNNYVQSSSSDADASHSLKRKKTCQ